MLNDVQEPIVLPAQAHADGPPPRWKAEARLWRALLWAEWYSHSRVLLIFLAVWLIAVWTLPLFTHTGWLLALGAIYALLAGPLYGGGDVLEGCEEFTFALPPTRGERYIARLMVGGGTLLLLTSMNMIALGLDLPQLLAGLYVRSGIIEPAPLLKPGLLYSLVVALPVAVFSFAFTLAATTHSRMLILASWFWAILAGMALLQIGFAYENLVHERLNGGFACPLLALASAAALAAGFFKYQRKEIGKPSLPLTLPGLWWLWTVLFVVGLGLAVSLANSLLKQFPELFR